MDTVQLIVAEAERIRQKALISEAKDTCGVRSWMSFYGKSLNMFL